MTAESYNYPHTGDILRETVPNEPYAQIGRPGTYMANYPQCGVAIAVDTCLENTGTISNDSGELQHPRTRDILVGTAS